MTALIEIYIVKYQAIYANFEINKNQNKPSQ